MNSTNKFETRPMLIAGTQAALPIGAGTGVNRQANAAGNFRVVTTLNEVKKLARAAAANLIKNFPKN